MRRPDDVPEDVFEAAGRALGSPSFTRQTVQARVARAIMAERERCAKIADHGLAEWVGVHQRTRLPVFAGLSQAAEFIATAIRKGS